MYSRYFTADICRSSPVRIREPYLDVSSVFSLFHISVTGELVGEEGLSADDHCSLRHLRSYFTCFHDSPTRGGSSTAFPLHSRARHRHAREATEDGDSSVDFQGFDGLILGLIFFPHRRSRTDADRWTDGWETRVTPPRARPALSH